MNSAQESKNELEASIRYAENAISSAKQTIESMEFRQEMAQKNYQEQTGREQALEAEVAQLKERADSLSATIQRLKEEHTQEIEELKSDFDNRMMTFKKRAEREVANLKECLKIETAALDRLREDTPTMPVIPKAVAIAIFREGMQHGVESACTELEGQTIEINENQYCGGFDVTFTKEIDLDFELDLDWMRGKVGDYSEKSVIDALGTLCADKEFECRIHGVDDPQEKKNED